MTTLQCEAMLMSLVSGIAEVRFHFHPKITSTEHPGSFYLKCLLMLLPRPSLAVWCFQRHFVPLTCVQRYHMFKCLETFKNKKRTTQNHIAKHEKSSELERA